MTGRRILAFALLCAIPLLTAAASAAVGLGGSRSSMRRQHSVAKKNNFTFLRNSRQVREFVRKERLVRLVGNEDYLVGEVQFPYARDGVKLFVERISAQYHAATGDRLVVTSLTRPMSRQPRNASPLSVHPAGMAVDFRVPRRQADRLWLERALLSLEDRSVLDATRERHPAHYHVAVFPREYSRYVAELESTASR